MDYEKKYKEAIKRASNIHKDAVEMENNMITKTCEVIFPELKESEDERIRKALINKIKCLDEEESKEGYSFYAGDYTADDCIAWLEKQGEQKPNVCDGCNNVKGCVVCVDGSEWAHIEELNPAWSEEDEERLSDAIFFVREYQIPTRDKRLLNAAKETEDWLKSLKERVQPQNTWKPSDKQMELLKEACDQHWEPDGLDPLYTLYQDLKKLKEE